MTSPSPPVFDHGAHSAPTNTMFMTLSPARGGASAGGGTSVTGGGAGLAFSMGGLGAIGVAFCWGGGDGGNSMVVGTFLGAGTGAGAGVGVRGGMIVRPSVLCGVAGVLCVVATGVGLGAIGVSVGAGGGFASVRGGPCIEGEGLGAGGLASGRVGFPGTTTGFTRPDLLGLGGTCALIGADDSAGCDGGVAALGTAGVGVAGLGASVEVADGVICGEEALGVGLREVYEEPLLAKGWGVAGLLAGRDAESVAARLNFSSVLRYSCRHCAVLKRSCVGRCICVRAQELPLLADAYVCARKSYQFWQMHMCALARVVDCNAHLIKVDVSGADFGL
jgi:hypothetical protein